MKLRKKDKDLKFTSALQRVTVAHISFSEKKIAVL